MIKPKVSKINKITTKDMFGRVSILTPLEFRKSMRDCCFPADGFNKKAPLPSTKKAIEIARFYRMKVYVERIYSV